MTRSTKLCLLNSLIFFIHLSFVFLLATFSSSLIRAYYITDYLNATTLRSYLVGFVGYLLMAVVIKLVSLLKLNYIK